VVSPIIRVLYFVPFHVAVSIWGSRLDDQFIFSGRVSDGRSRKQLAQAQFPLLGNESNTAQKLGPFALVHSTVHLQVANQTWLDLIEHGP
jgi:hypothetical protein